MNHRQRMRRYLNPILATVLCTWLAACGGGGSDPDAGSAIQSSANCEIGASTLGNCNI